MKINTSKLTLYVPIADIICELIFDNPLSFSYFKKRFNSLPSASDTSMKITITETPTEFVFLTFPENIHCKINKSHVSSLEEIYFIMRALVEYYIIQYDILLLHASSLIKNGKTYVFMAPSGSGKSTIVSSVPRREVLSDDVAVLKKTNRKFYVFTSPFDNKKYAGLHLRKAQLGKIFFIKQASFTKFTREGYAETLRNVLHNNLLILWFGKQKKKKEQIYKQRETQLYKVGLDLVTSTRIKTLYFTKDLDFMSLL